MLLCNLLTKTPRHDARLLQQLRWRVCAHIFHHRQQHSSGGFGVGLGVVVVKLMADVRRQGVELVVWQVRPDASGYAAGAKIIKLWTAETEMVQGGAQMPYVEVRNVRDHDVGAGQPFQEFRRNGGKFGSVLNIKPGQAVNFSKVLPKPSVRFWWPNQPIGGLHQDAILKDGHPGGTDADPRIIGRFKVYAREVHCVLEALVAMLPEIIECHINTARLPIQTAVLEAVPEVLRHTCRS